MMMKDIQGKRWEDLYLIELKKVSKAFKRFKSIIPKPKYEVGQEVFFNSDIEQEIYSFCIHTITKEDDEEYYLYGDIDDDFCVTENRLYPSRQALIESQIEYWKGLKQEQVVPVEEGSESKMCPKFEGGIKGFRCFDDELEVRQCEHESESISSWGIIKSCEGDINKPFKCKKCGEYFR